MKIEKFFAATSREALRQVRQGLGPDAVILSNRQAEGGVEIMALASADLSCLMLSPGQEADAGKARAGGLASSNKGDSLQPHGRAPQAPVAESITQSMVSEIQTLRGMLEDQLATVIWGDVQRREPGKAKILRALLAAGFSPSLSRHLLDELPGGCDQEQNLNKAVAALTGALRTAASDGESPTIW